jgi:hypothetical protein
VTDPKTENKKKQKKELAQSIRELGILQPILVRKRSAGGFATGELHHAGGHGLPPEPTISYGTGSGKFAICSQTKNATIIRYMNLLLKWRKT